jgi:hypothetical protein
MVIIVCITEYNTQKLRVSYFFSHIVFIYIINLRIKRHDFLEQHYSTGIYIGDEVCSLLGGF